MPHTADKARTGVIAIILALGVVAVGAETFAWQRQPNILEKSKDQVVPQPPRVARTDSLGDPLPEGAIARVGTTRLRANGYINVIAFSHDGRLLAYGSEHGLVHVCDAADGKPLFELKLEEGRIRPVTELAFSPDGKTLAASGYWSPALWLIDLATHKIRHTIPNTVAGQDRWSREYQGPAFAFTPDGGTLVVGGKDGALHLWDAATGTRQAALAEAKELVLSLTLTADGRTALTAHYRGALHLWDVAKRKHLRKLALSANHPQLTALAPDGKMVALAASSTDLELHGLDGGRRHQLRTAAPIAGLGFSPDGMSLQVADGDGNVESWDVRTGKKRKSLICKGISMRWDERGGPKPWAWFRPDGKVMAWSTVGIIHPWDLTTGKETPRLSLYRRGIEWAGFAADGRLLRTGGSSGELVVWDLATGRPQPLRTTDLTTNARFTPNAGYTPAADRGKIIAVIRDDKSPPGEGRIFIWDPTGGASPIPLRHQAAPAWSAALTPDNRFVVAADGGGQIWVYDAAAGKPVRSLKGRKYEYHPTLSPDGALLAMTASEIRLYDFATGRVLREMKGQSPATCVAFSPDGRLLASGHASLDIRGQQGQAGDMICLWDAASGRELWRMPSGHYDVRALAFSPDCRLIASCGIHGAVRLWEAVSGQDRRSYDGHRSWVQSVDFSPDGRRLASASYDGTALIWRVFDPAPAKAPTADLESLWANLAKDGTSAHRAMAALIAAEETVAFLKSRLKPIQAPDPRRIQSLLADLGSNRFTDRDRARIELERLDDLAEPALERFLKGDLPLEARRRAEAILAKVQGPITDPHRLQQLRAVEVLEYIARPGARQVLEMLSKGAPEARLTREARESLQRLAKREGKSP